MKTVRRTMEKCPFCGSLESARVTHTRSDAFGNVIRYRVCVKCHKRIPALVLVRPRDDPSSD